MTPHEFLDEFGTLAESAQGVPKLRELILELAVRGKLVEQDQAEEESNGAGSHDPALADILLENSLNGYGKRPNSEPPGVPLLRISAGTSRGDFFVDETDHKWADVTNKIQEKFELIPGDLLACRFNGNLHYVGRFSYYQGETEIAPIFPDKLIRFRIDPDVAEPRYVCLAMNSRPCRLKIESFCATTAGNIGISATNLKTVTLRVPPLAEQHRIVSKVDELMGLCDRLEAVQGERRGVRVRLNRSSLDRLTSVSTARGSGLSAAWQRVCDHFEVLYDTPETLPDLRQTILQLAVQGKLVPQDPIDEPAEERARKSEPPAALHAGEDTVLEPCPPNDGATIYPMVTMEELVGQKNMKNGLSVTQTTAPTEYRCLSLSALRDGVVDCSGGKPVPLTDERAEPYLIRRNDVFVVRGNGSKDFVGRAGIANPDDDPVGAIFPDLFIRLPLDTERINLDYFLIAWNSPLARVTIEELAQTTSGIWKVNQGHIASISIPLPGLSEQKRIVLKVDPKPSVAGHLPGIDPDPPRIHPHPTTHRRHPRDAER